MQPHGFWMKGSKMKSLPFLKDRLQENSGRKQKPDKRKRHFYRKTEQKQAPVLIEARNLKQHFRIRSDYTIHAVDDVFLQCIREGRSWHWWGDRMRKSTTARTLAGIYRPTGGEIFIREKECRMKKGSFRNAEENADGDPDDLSGFGRCTESPE